VQTCRTGFRQDSSIGVPEEEAVDEQLDDCGEIAQVARGKEVLEGER